MDCPYIPILSYHEFSKSIHEKTIKERIPIGGDIEPTLRCNLRCAHCYVADAPRKKEASFEEICRIIDEIADAGCLWLLFTGGEPFMREDFLDIYAYAKRKGLIITIFTNGTLLTPEIADYLKEFPPFAVEITLSGATKEIYERVSGVPGSFERCIQGIEYLLSRGINLRLKTTVMSLNLEGLWDIKRYVEGLGLEFRFDPVLNPRIDGSKAPCRLRIPPEEVVALDLADESRSKEWKRLAQGFLKPTGADKLFNCGAGILSFHIDPYGGLSPCLIARTASYDLLKGSFKEGWHDFIPKVINQRPKNDYQCGKCKFIVFCGQCPGWAQLEHGDPERRIDYLCRIGHLRAKAFGAGSDPQGVEESLEGARR